MSYINGVDRSHNNSKIQLIKLIPKGIGFIWFKATQGETFKDPAFNDSWKEVKSIIAIKRGCYHFFDPRFDGILQAKNYLSSGVNFSDLGCLPPCIDVEDLVGSNKTDTATLNKWVIHNRALSLSRLNDFLLYVKNETGKDCIIYSYNNYLKDTFNNHPWPNNELWLSSLQKDCPVRFDNGKLPLFWQNTYSWNGTDMDGDYFTGTQEQLNLLANIK